jgi:hypothetical protein
MYGCEIGEVNHAVGMEMEGLVQNIIEKRRG